MSHVYAALPLRKSLHSTFHNDNLSAYNTESQITKYIGSLFASMNDMRGIIGRENN